MNQKALISLLVGTLFSGGGLYLAFRNVPLASLSEYALHFRYGWLLPSAACLVLAYLIRSMRWQWLLMPAGKPRLASAYHSIVISMMANCLLPGRIGELVRPVVIKKLEQTPLSSSLAALGVERLLDLAALLMLLLPTLVLLPPDADAVVAFGTHQLSRDLLVHLGTFSLLTSLCLLLIVYAIGSDRLRSRLISWVNYIPVLADRVGASRLHRMLQTLSALISNIIERGARGVAAVCHWKGLLTGIFASLIFWGCNALTFYFVSIGSPDLNLPFLSICNVMVVICFFIALPSVPGYWGLWEAAGVYGLALFGVPRDVAAGYALFTHAFNIFPVLIAGWLSCLAIGLRWRNLARPAPADLAEGQAK
jgi:uncharacterized protein (TIRG00374 family)